MPKSLGDGKGNGRCPHGLYLSSNEISELILTKEKKKRKNNYSTVEDGHNRMIRFLTKAVRNKMSLEIGVKTQ